MISKEREMNVKHQHMISGVSLFAYWFANFLWDFIKHIIPTVVCSLIILAFQIDVYTGTSDSYGGMWVLIILTGICSAPFSYFFSFFFKKYSTAQMVMLIFSFVTGSIFPSAVFALYLFDSTRDVGKAFGWILKIFPNFCFGWGVLLIGAGQSFAGFEGRNDPYDAFDINSAGGCMLLLGIMTFVYFFLVIMAELYETNPKFAQKFRISRHLTSEVYEHDEDVDKEAALAEQTNPDDVQINVKKLTKSFKIGNKTMVAVNGVSFNVYREECFALLGVNGAGKTTTFKMLTGEVICDSGSGFVGGKSVMTQLPEARNLIGYCPQFDALSENLTGREHLELYAHIKGIPKNRIKEQIELMLNHMDLVQYADILASTYSGGNKRKLSVAMALIGNPSVVFLDEPSAGMDPEARKKMWKILGNIKKLKSAVILTTHSMEEAEALCDRMTIMVRGRLKCIGSSTWIKNKFGDGYELEIKIEIPSHESVRAETDKITAVLGKNNITFAVLDQALETLQSGYLRPLIVPGGAGSSIYSTITSDGYISKEALASWCLTENHAYYYKSWLDSEFKNVETIEHYNLMSKFKLKKEIVGSVGTLFAAVERNKIAMKISDYSITMTSLEQIFNRFAKKAEAEELANMQSRR